MSKHIKFEKIFRTTNDDLIRATIKQDGIILGHGALMSVAEVEEWIKSCYEFIEEKKDDIRVAEASIRVFKGEFNQATAIGIIKSN
jgi:hypothetical protein